MTYQVEGGLWSNVFAVPGQIVDEHLKLCGAASLKALLIILRRGGSGQAEEIAQLLSLPMADVTDALNYWVHLGVLRQAEQAAPSREEPEKPRKTALVYTLEPPEFEREKEEEAPEPKAATGPKPGDSRRRLTTRQINEMGRSDENIAYLLQESQSVLGKPLTPVATDTITALYSYYGMAPDLILMLLHYCASLGKDNMRYVEKVAASWLEAGIDSHQKAEAEILRATQRGKTEHRIQKLLGINDRALISSEQEHIRVWTEEMGATPELIRVAYERTIEQKGKLSFAYLNGILKNWQAKGIKTPAQANQDMLEGAAKFKKRESKQEKEASYSMEELEQLTYSRG